VKPRHARAQADDGTNESRKRFEAQRPARGIRYAFVWAIGAPELKLGGDVMFRHRKKNRGSGARTPRKRQLFHTTVIAVDVLNETTPSR
jgi:hypothetical protein